MSEIAFSELTWQELLDYREKILHEQENLEAAISVIKDEVVARLAEEGIQGKVVGNTSISLRTSYTTDKKTAQELGAIKTVTQERIDVGMIKELHLKGVEVPNLIINKTPIITEIKKEEVVKNTG